jgi:uncharacterized membrane protein
VRVTYIDRYDLTDNETLSLCRLNGFAVINNPNLQLQENIPDTISHSAIVQQKTWENVAEATIQDSGNAIGYQLMLYYWSKLFGDTNFALRMFSAIFGILTVILGYYFCRQLFNKRTATIGGILLCLHPVLIEYSQMARTYSLATFFILLTTYSIYQISVAKKHVWLHIPLYVISLNLSLFSHYVTLYIFIAHILLVAFFHSHKKALVQYAIMAIFSFGIFSIWLFNGGYEGKKIINIERSMWQHNVAVNGEEPEVVTSASDTFYQVVMNFVRIFGNDLDTEVRNYGYYLLLLVPFAIVFFVFLKVRKSEFFRPVMFVTFPLALYVVMIIAMVIRTQHTIPFDIRYATFVIPFACMLLAFGFDRMIEWNDKLKVPAYALIVVVILVMVVGLKPGMLRSPNMDIRKRSFVYQDASSFLNSNIVQGDTISFHSKEDIILTDFYMRTKLDPIFVIDYSQEEMIVIKGDGKRIRYAGK